MVWSYRILPALLLALLFPTLLEAQWREVHNGGSVFYNEVFFIDADHGWVTEQGPTVVRTTNRGASWQTSSLPNATSSANRDICFVSTSVGYVSGNDGVWKSVNGGSTWTKLTVTGSNGGTNSSVWFIDANTGVYAEGGGNTAGFFSTTDGGSTWSVVRDTVPGSVTSVGGVAYMNGKFYVAADGGNLWRSTDNGITWEHFVTGANGWQEDMISYGGKLYIASADGSISGTTGGGKILVNTTSDTSWYRLSFAAPVMWGVTMVSTSTGWACGESGKAFRTLDGWATYSDRSCGIDPNAHIDDIWFADAANGWCVGQARPTNGIAHGAVYQYVGDHARAIPDTIDFGELLVGTTSADRIAKVLSVGSGLTLTRVIAGNDPTQFGATGGLTGAQSPPGYCGEASTPLHFKPTSIGQKRAYLEYTYANGTPGPRVVLLGRGVKPDLTAPRVLIYDTLQCSIERLDTILVGNDGFYPLTVSSVSFTNLFNGTFQLVSPALPATIPSGTTTRFVVRAIATGPGPVTGTMSIVNNDPDRTPYLVSLSAFRQRIAVGFDRDTLLAVASAPIGQSVTVCINYRNTGNGPQKIESVLPVGPGSTSIVHTPSMAGQSLRVGDPAAPICFQVTPTDTGWVTRRFQIRTGPCGLDTFVTVRVFGTSPLIASAQQKLFADLCGTGMRDTIELYNRGNVPLVVQQPTIDGSDRTLFTLISPTAWPVTIAPGAMVPVDVRYAPPAFGTHTAALHFRSNDRRPGREEWTVALLGTRESVRLRARERTRDVGSICLGNSVDATLALWNEGTAPVSFGSAVFIDAPAGVRLVSGTVAGVSIATGTFAPLTIRIEGLATGDFTARLAIIYDPCGMSDTIVLSGRVVSSTLALDRPLDLGELPLRVEARQTVNVINTGTVAATLRNVRLAVPDPGITINAGTLPLVIPPGGSTPVEVVLTPTAVASESRALLIEGEGLCADTLNTLLTYSAIDAQVISDRIAISFDPLLPCNAAAGWLDTLELRNFASTEARITGARLARGTAGFGIDGPIPTAIPAGGRIGIGILFRPAGAGSWRDTLIVETTVGSISRTLRVPLVGTSERLDLAAVDSRGDRVNLVAVEQISVCTPVRSLPVILENFGTLPDTVTVTSPDPALVVLTPMPVIIPAGEQFRIDLRAARGGSGGIRDIALQLGARTCDRDSTLTIRLDELDLATTLGSLDYRVVNVGRTVELQAELVNNGTSDRTIDRVQIADASSPFLVLDDLSGRTIGAGDTLRVPIRFSPTVEGALSTGLLAILTTPCDDTLRSTVTGTGVKSAIFIETRELDFGARFRCDALCQEVVIEGVGTMPVTISRAAVASNHPAARWTVSPSNFPLVVLPGSSLTLTLCFDAPATVASVIGNFVIETDDQAQPRIEIPVEGRTIGGLAADSAIAFETDPVSGGDSSIMVRNGSDIAITIDRIELPPGFEIVDPLPIVVPAGGEQSLTVLFRPDAPGATGRGLIILGHSLPCRDSVVMAVDAAGAGLLTTSAPDIRGRWGTKIRVPVSLDNPRALSLGELALDVTADPRLLQPLAATPSEEAAAAGWRVDGGTFDARTGAYGFTLKGPSGTSSQPRGVVAWVEYEVLRGDLVSTPITPVAGGVPPGVATGSTAGSFVLEDYCDAYGRLLRTEGRFKLSQNLPNPVRERTTIEIEIPFAGEVTLVIHDATGREISRPIDEWMPAGTRRVDIDAAMLSSGIYTYRLRLGLLVESRRMVIAR